MQVTKETLTPTTIKLTFSGDAAELDVIKQHVLKELAGTVKLQGFRDGKAPMHLIERNVDQNRLQQEFLEHAINDLYVKAIDQEKVRPVAQPAITVSKFVPFSTLEAVAEVEAIGDITVPDYTKLSVKRTAVNVTDKQIDEVIKDLQTRLAKREDVDRAAKKGDEVTIDFAGTDTKTKEELPGTKSEDYALVIGSGNFIPGFEEEVIGLKAGAEKTFDITFPADYGAKDMQNKQVTFAVTVKKVQAIVAPKVDDEFAAQIGKFKTVEELRTDIRRELEGQAKQEAERQYDNELLEAIAKKTKVELPKPLVDEELERLEAQEKQGIIYRGQTWQEHLDEEGVTEDEHREKNRAGAELRVKTGLILGEIAENENVKVSPEELEIRIQLLKGQYANDPRMQEELDKPENRRDVLSRLMTEKTLDKLKSLQ
jgi:trigger factor